MNRTLGDRSRNSDFHIDYDIYVFPGLLKYFTLQKTAFIKSNDVRYIDRDRDRHRQR